MRKGKNSSVSSSKKIIEVDEEQVLEVIENKEFLTMKAAASSWPVPSTTEEQLKELADEGLIQGQDLA
jgi:ATP phosphoribosyltransferase regulatory subunit HisZ